MTVFAALIAGFGLCLMVLAAMQTEIEQVRERALVGAFGLILLILGVAMM